ncbi:uncharacterized protein LOC128245018 [Mya arenaria]|uniref:uncharacterized protein LOC128245018 n=1 Tax=Mya arenaria TaxID=6604 RepID=UPI0022DF5A25|nr:uncharacterized protein LOC128245018 [Mya arenaria]
MCPGSRRLAELQEMLRFTSGFVPNAVQMISEHIYKDETANSLVDDAMFTIIQKTLVSCIREAKPLGPKPRSVNIKVIILNTLSDQEVLPLVYPESVNRLDITEYVQLDKEQIDCIFAMVNLNHLVIMNDEEVLKSDIMVALLKICKHLKRLELDDYHLLNDPELTILPTSCRLSYISLFRCKLTHSHITSMISDVPTLKDLKLTVTCEPDGQCGCLKQIQSVAGAKSKTDDQELMKSACVTNIQVYESSGVFDHLKDSNTLKCLKVMDSTAEKSLGKFTGQCVKLEDLELDSVTFSRYSDGYSLNGGSLQQLKLNDVDIDYRIILSTINISNTIAPFDIKLDQVRLIGINADEFKSLLLKYKGVSIESFSGDEGEVKTSTLKVVKESTDLVGKTDILHEDSTTNEIASRPRSRFNERTKNCFPCVLF